MGVVDLSGVADLVCPPPAGVLQWRDDPAGFAEHAIQWPAGEGPTFYQRDALTRLAESHRLALRGPHGLGKSALACWAVLWFSLTRDAAGRDWKCPSTAPGWPQLRQFLWPAVTKQWLPRIDWQAVGREPLTANEQMTLELRLRHGSAFAISSDDPARIEGAHAESLFFLLDEARGIKDDIWDSVEGALTGGSEAFVLAVSTPGEPSGRFFQIHDRAAGTEDWDAMHVRKDDAIAAGRMTQGWAKRRAALWGRRSALYIKKVEGDFARQDAQAILPAAWVEAAMERHAERGELEPLTAVGVDVAHEGVAATVLAIRHGLTVDRLVKFRRQSTTATARRVASILRGTDATAIVDADGLGVGTFDALRDLEASVIPFHGQERTERRDRTGELIMGNRRTGAIWHLRELADPEQGSVLMLPPDDELLADLCATRWKMVNGRVQAERKEEVAKRIGRSPDCGDAVMLAFAPGAQARVTGPPIAFKRPGGSRNALFRQRAGGGMFGGFGGGSW
ncbi:MAG: hypothetical protein ACYCUM_13620 [Solirubrobacteraceae bacterium]